MSGDKPQPLDAYRQALESIAANSCCEGCQEAKRVAEAALRSPTLDPKGLPPAGLREVVSLLEEASERRRILRPELHEARVNDASEDASYAEWLAAKALAILKGLAAERERGGEG